MMKKGFPVDPSWWRAAKLSRLNSFQILLDKHSILVK